MLMGLMVKLGGLKDNAASIAENKARRVVGDAIKPLGWGITPELNNSFADVAFEAQDGTMYLFELAPLVDFSKEKHIVTTDINDGKGEVVEIISTRAWVIDLQGVLIDSNTRTHPRQQIEELIALFEKNESFRVYGDLFEEKGISDVFFTGIGLPSETGKPDTQRFSLSARSVVPPEISLIEP